ncbi:FAD-dependent oxidoreductase [Haliovirga abyssi]|uniref:Oxidoreductase n=1 Tax=Haliovirga abyssi TaxID=2996794 RepID=A0AAU9DEV2_9FUSO|nr:FAD-dependent oxidoreductase [Haliovirga abyssi]BDU50723.1 oxidoreductase [Haliovirga abyssi]
MGNKKNFFAPIKAWKYLVKKPISIPMEDIFENPREAADRYRGFHANDWEKCIGCGTCSEICPTNAIVMQEREELPDEDGSKPEKPAIDYGRCTFCGLCVDICTTNSLTMTKEYVHISKDVDDFYFLPKENGIHDIKYENAYVRDEVSELLDLKRYDMVGLEADERKDSFIEIVKGFSKETAIAEASRCVECGICTKTCPATMNIPEYILSIWKDDLEEGVDWLYKTNPLPGVCGRICTHKCETACALGNRGEAVSIRWLKRYIVDNTPEEDYEKVVLANVSKGGEGKVAIVGAGPAGISAGYYLRTMGYEVDIFEAMPLAGGVMRYGIPQYRLPDYSLDKDISFIEKIGVKIHTNTQVGKDIQLEELHSKYDVVFLGTGFFGARGLNIPNSDHKDVHLAMDFLPQVRDFARGVIKDIDVHKSAVVIGGGNVAFDVARSLIRLQEIKYGKSDVKLIALENEEQLPADREEYEEGMEEGIKYQLGCGPQEVMLDDKGNIKGVKGFKCLSIFDGQHRFNPQFDTSDVKMVEGTQVYVSIGQSPDYSYLDKELEEKLGITRGKITKIGKNRQVEGVDWLFAGGDIVQGPDVIHGIADGHEAAKAIDEYLMNGKNKKK